MMTDNQPGNKSALVWDNVSCHVKTGIPCVRREKKQILSNVSGFASRGTLSAIMGPSGSGKTTLLNCLSGRKRKNVSGKIVILTMADDVRHNVRIGFVPQKDGLFMEFTVRESILFASQMNNGIFTMEDHKKLVNEIIDSMDLRLIADSLLTDISGGELKRTSIGLELVSRPDILLLDEPTTGLDSDNSESVVLYLQKTAHNFSLIVIATIHQPSYDALCMFDQVYVLSKYGTSIFAGPSDLIMQRITNTGLPARENINPAEYLIEVANGKHGQEIIEKMTKNGNEVAQSTKQSRVLETPVTRMPNQFHGSSLYQTYLLIKRRLSGELIKSHNCLFRVVLAIASTLVLCYIPAERMGKASGCWKDVLVHGDSNMSEMEAIKQSLLGLSANESTEFDVSDENERIRGSMSFFLFLSSFNMLTAIISVSTYYPTSIGIIFREISNHWYSTGVYFVSLVICEVIFTTLCTFTTTPIAWFASEFPNDKQRLVILTIAVTLMTLICCFRGVIFSILFAPNNIFAMIGICALTLMVTFTSGFMFKTDSLTGLMQMVTYISDVKYFFTISFSTSFGLNRCPDSGGLSDFIIHDVLQKKSMIRLAAGIWPLLNMTPGDLVHAATVLNLPSDYFDQLIDPVSDFLGESDGSDIIGDVHHHASYVMDDMRISDDDIIPAFIFLTCSCCIACLLILVTLKLKITISR